MELSRTETLPPYLWEQKKGDGGTRLMPTLAYSQVEATSRAFFKPNASERSAAFDARSAAASPAPHRR